MSFHFPGSAPRVKRHVSFDTPHSGSHDKKNSESNRMENPLLSNAKQTPPSQPVQSDPLQPSPFESSMLSITQSVGIRHRHRKPLETTLSEVTTEATQSQSLSHRDKLNGNGNGNGSSKLPITLDPNRALPPPPRASLSWGDAVGMAVMCEEESNNAINAQKQIPRTQDDPTQTTATAPLNQRSHTYSFHNLPNTTISEQTSSTTNSLHNPTLNSNCWILVFGYQSNSQRQQVLGYFTKIAGRVLEQRTGMHGSMAVRFESALHACKCPSHFTLPDGTVCGAVPLADTDPRLTFFSHEQPLLRNTTLSQKNELSLTSKNYEHTIRNDDGIGTTTTAAKEITEEDVLLISPIRLQPKWIQRRSLCEQIWRWILAVD